MPSINVSGTGTPLAVPIGTLVTLDAVPGGATSYLWSFVDIPDGSAATFSAPTAVSTTFTVDVVGSYLIRLVVDGVEFAQAVVASPIATPLGDLRIPAYGETNEADGAKGWQRALAFGMRLAALSYNGLAEGNLVAAKNAARVAADAATALSGATPLAIDGVTLADGDRVLLTAQGDPVENGLYVFTDDGMGGYTLTRAGDMAAGETMDGVVVPVYAGTIYGRQWFFQTSGPDVVGTDGMTLLPGAGGGTGIIMPAGWTAEVIDDRGGSGDLILEVTTTDPEYYRVALTQYIPPSANFEIGFEAGEGW